MPNPALRKQSNSSIAFLIAPVLPTDLNVMPICLIQPFFEQTGVTAASARWAAATPAAGSLAIVARVGD